MTSSPARRSIPLARLSGGALPCWRALTLAATTLLVAVVVVGLFVHVASDPGSAVGALLRMPSPTPAATFVPGANLLYFSNGAPWGTLTVDGKRLPQADLTGHAVTVTRGAHQLVYQARYFPTVRCVFSAPQTQSDTCRLDTSYAANQFLLSKAPLARVIDLGSTVATLQPDQLAAILRLANTQLQAQLVTATIAPGERYLDDSGRVVVASAPLQFQMTFWLDDAVLDGAPCAQICPSSPFIGVPGPPGGGWLVNAVVNVSWAIADASGRRLTSPSYMSGQATVTVLGIQLTSAGWKLNWLDALSDMAVQEAAQMAAFDAVNKAGKNSNGVSFALAPHPLDGCVMDVEYGDGMHTVRVFWRFGALLAVDAKAHAVLPQLPVANAQEQATVTSILMRPSAT